MVDGYDKFYGTIKVFDESLKIPESKSSILNRCIEQRLSDVMQLQSTLFDESLSELQDSITFDFSDIKSMCKITTVLQSLYKRIATDRIQLIDNLIELIEFKG